METQQFKFADLPRELRDKVYEHLGVDRDGFPTIEMDLKGEPREKEEAPGVRLSISNGPDTRLLLVSPSLGAEYATRTATRSSWIFTDTNMPLPSQVSLAAATFRTQGIRAAHFNLLAGCDSCHEAVDHGSAFEQDPDWDDFLCDVERDVNHHADWIKKTLESGFRHVQHYTIQLFLYDMCSLKPTWPLMCGNPHLLAALERLSQLDIEGKELRGVEVVITRRTISRFDIVHKLADLKDFTSHAHWTRKNGWQPVVHPAQEAEVQVEGSGARTELDTSESPLLHLF